MHRLRPQPGSGLWQSPLWHTSLQACCEGHARSPRSPSALGFIVIIRSQVRLRMSALAHVDAVTGRHRSRPARRTWRRDARSSSGRQPGSCLWQSPACSQHSLMLTQPKSGCVSHVSRLDEVPHVGTCSGRHSHRAVRLMSLATARRTHTVHGGVAHAPAPVVARLRPLAKSALAYIAPGLLQSTRMQATLAISARIHSHHP